MKSLAQMDLVHRSDGTLLQEFVQMETYILDSITRSSFEEYLCDAGAMPFIACLDIAAPDTLSLDKAGLDEYKLGDGGLDTDPSTFTYANSSNVVEDRLLQLSWAFASGSGSDDFDSTGAIALNQTIFPKARYGSEVHTCQNKTHGDGVITPLDMVILLWNQFLIPPYTKEDQTEWYFIRTVDGETPADRCQVDGVNDWDYSKYYEKYFENAEDAKTFCQGQLNLERVSGDSYTRQRRLAAPEASPSAAPVAPRRLQTVPYINVAEQGGVAIETFRHGVAPGGVWFHVHIPIATFAFDIVLDGVMAGTRVPLSNQPAPYNQLDLNPLDPSKIEVRFSRYDLDGQGSKGRECASIMGALTSGIALYGNRLALQQMPSPRRHRLCRFDVFIFVPFSSSSGRRLGEAGSDQDEPCEAKVSKNSVLMAAVETKVTSSVCIPRSRKEHIALTRTADPPPPPLPSPLTPSPSAPPPAPSPASPPTEDDDFPVVPVVIGVVAAVVVLAAVGAAVAAGVLGGGASGGTSLLLGTRASTAPIVTSGGTATNAAGAAGTRSVTTVVRPQGRIINGAGGTAPQPGRI